MFLFRFLRVVWASVIWLQLSVICLFSYFVGQPNFAKKIKLWLEMEQ